MTDGKQVASEARRRRATLVLQMAACHPVKERGIWNGLEHLNKVGRF